MKIFWSWQSDTPGPIGRHFIRDAIAQAIAHLSQPEEIEEPTEQKSREAIELDQDRQGVSGSPDLARLIFNKIAAADVFLADVTLVGTVKGKGRKRKPLINANVAIELGYALHALGDEFLMVQNTYYGNRDGLPFDLKHKAGPIQYFLEPTATADEIKAEKAKLRARFVDAIKECLKTHTNKKERPNFVEMPATRNIACFWKPGDILATTGDRFRQDGDYIEYRFEGEQAFYLRLIPTRPLSEPLPNVQLLELVQRRQINLMTRTIFGAGSPGRNAYGVISYEASGMSPTPLAFTQLFPNGEIWSITRELFATHQDIRFVPMTNLRTFYRSAVENFAMITLKEYKISPPYEIEMGAVGLQNLVLTTPNDYIALNKFTDVVHQNDFKMRRAITDVNPEICSSLIELFCRHLYDLAGYRL